MQYSSTNMKSNSSKLFLHTTMLYLSIKICGEIQVRNENHNTLVLSGASWFPGASLTRFLTTKK